MSKYKRIAAGAVAAMSIISVSGFAAAVPASAATSAEIQAQIQALLAQIAALQTQLGTGATASCFTFSRDITLGSTGEDVRALQVWLNANGYIVATAGPGSKGNETTYFGGLTRTALAKYQVAAGISPAVGYFGPITRARVNATCTTTGGGGTGTSSTSTPDDDDDTLDGGAGSIEDADFVSGINDEEVGEDEEDVEVAALDIEVDDGSDIEVTAVRLVFLKTSSGAGSSDDFEDYADEVSFWLDGEEVGRVDADEFNDDNDFSKTVSLDSGAIIDAGENGELSVAVSGISNLDSDDEGETWSVEFDSVRFQDADGATISDDSTGDIGGATREFSFESFATAADTELKVALNEDDDDVNEAHVIDIDDADDTDNVEILSFTLEVEGDSDVMIDEIPVMITVAEPTDDNDYDDPDDVIAGIRLMMGDDEVGSENLLSTDANDNVETVTFDDLDLTIGADSEEEFHVEVDLIETGGVIDNGDTVEADLGTVQLNAIDAEDESGEDIAAADRSGTANGEAHAVYDEGIMVEFVESDEEETFTADDTGEEDQGTYSITFDVTAFDGDMRLDKTCAEDENQGDPGEGSSYLITNSGNNSTTCTLTSDETDTEDNSLVFEVDEDTTRTFTLTVVATADATETAFAEVSLEAINWGTLLTDLNPNFYTFNLEDFKTGPLNLAGLP